MLNETQKNNFTPRAKAEAKKLLQSLSISNLTDNNIGELQDLLDIKVSGLVSTKENGNAIDEELLEIYDLLTDIVLDNEENLELLNNLFFD